MTTPDRPASVPKMTNEKGAEFAARRKAIGISARALADRAGVDRGSIAKIENGERVRYAVVGAVDKALADLEHEMGMDLPSQVATLSAPADDSGGVIEFDITGDFGVHVVVKGPVRDAALLRQQTAELIREIRSKKADPSQG